MPRCCWRCLCTLASSYPRRISELGSAKPALDRRAPASVSRKSTRDGYSFSGSGAILLPCSTLLGAQFPSAAVPEIGPRTSLVSRFHVERSDNTMLSKILSPALVPWVSGGLAFLVAVGLTPIVRWGARRGGWVAIPEDEKWHDTPTTILGGIAIFLGGTVALIVSGGVSAFPAPVWGGAVLLIGTGLIDDLWGLGPVAKLTAQLGSAALVLSAGFLLAPDAPIWGAVPLTLVWLLGLPNAVNLLDAMDGVAASVTALAAAFLGLVAGLQGLGALATAAAVLAGATAGFLV